MRHFGIFALLGMMMLLVGCDSDDQLGLLRTPSGTGPTVRFDLDHKPLPEIPLPNNIATVHDPTSPTGRRVNVSLHGVTMAEEELREKIHTMDGFGIFSPITVAFEEPLDLVNIRERQTGNHAFTDDTVLLVNIDRGLLSGFSLTKRFGSL